MVSDEKLPEREEKQLKEVNGKCRFCGQIKIMNVPESYTEEQIDEMATRECKCFEAKQYMIQIEAEEKIEAAKLSAKGTAFELFHEEYPDVEKFINAAIDPLCEKKFKKLTIDTGKQTKAKVSYSAGTIKVEREDKAVYKRETTI